MRIGSILKVDEMGVDQEGVDQVGIFRVMKWELTSRRNGSKPVRHGV